METENPNGSRKGIELEKFKRRMIRSVARKLKEKKPGDEMWVEMKKEIGANCKKLWERMRMLTLKKLKRLLEADDRVEFIGPVARMTLTDWLLFDLVIVHEKIDVIDRERLNGTYDSKVLSNLFSLVQRFEIEGRSGENLAEAWTAATVYYNSKGHQCSPMMLQRRWYQIKELTRHKFYKFWFSYRGNQRALITAKQDSPDDLQKAIALKYPQVITEHFPTWEERIESRLVILPDELGVKMRQRNLMQASDTSAPDVVLVEPHIETIDLGANSEDEDEGLLGNDQMTMALLTADKSIKIKSEPIETDIDIDENLQQYENPPEKRSVFDEEIERLQMVEKNFDNHSENNDKGKSIVIDPVLADAACDHDDVNDQNDTALAYNIDEIVSDQNATELEKYNDNCCDAIVIDDDENDGEACIQMNASKEQAISNDREEGFAEGMDSSVDKTDDVSMNQNKAKIYSEARVGIKVENLEGVLESAINLNDHLEQQSDVNTRELLPVISTISSEGVKIENDLALSECTLENDVSNETTDEIRNEVMPVILSVSSNGVKVEIETDKSDDKQTAVSPTEESTPENDVIGKDDDQSLPHVDDFGFQNEVVDLNYAEEDIDFADDGIAYVEEDEDDIIKVTGPIPQLIKNESEDELTDETENESQDQASSDEATKEKAQKFDLKLLMCPVVYTTRLEDMIIFDDTLQYVNVEGIENINKINLLSKPISLKYVARCETKTEPEVDTSQYKIEKDELINNDSNMSDDDLFKDDNVGSVDSDSESDIIPDSKRVKMSSYLLQKPRHRSYNPVILCKNPDFNTRLKKLSVGFFMSNRNRMLLQSCIPMTIDLTKAFENKLIDGTLYLKDIPQVSIVKTEPVIKINDDIEMTSTDLIQSTAVQQTMMNIDETLEKELKKRMAERVRAINLPDISQVRRLNQHLLTAEVTPLILGNQTSQNTKLDLADHVQNLKDDINHLLAKQTIRETSNHLSVDIPLISKVTDLEPTPPPLLVKNPQLCMQLNSPSSLSNLQPLLSKNPVLGERSTPPSLVSIANSSRLGEITSNPANDPVGVTPPVSSIGTVNIAGQNKDKINANSASDSVAAKRKMRKTYYPTPAWNKPKINPNQPKQEQLHSDVLLTLDTLYKMLSALDPCSSLQAMLPKKKVKNKKKLANEKKNCDHNERNNTNQDSVIDITDGDDEIIVPAKKPRSKPQFRRKIRVKNKLFCCYISYKDALDHGEIDDDATRRRHRCMTDMCNCCCKSLYPEHIRAVKSIEKLAKAKDADEIQVLSEQFVSEVTEQGCNEGKQLERGYKQKTGTESLLNDYGDPCSDEDLPVAEVPSVNAVVTTSNAGLGVNRSIDDIAELKQSSPVKMTPIPKVRVYSGKTASTNMVRNSFDLDLPSNSQIISNDTLELNTNLENTTIPMTKTNVTQHELSQSKIHWNVTDTCVKPSPKNTDEDVSHTIIKRKIGRPRKLPIQPKTVPCLCRPNISNVKQGKIEINGGNDCVLHTIKKQVIDNKVGEFREKHNKLKDKKIILSKKLVNDETQPFFVGKGKILLTNIKMPSKNTPPPPSVPQFKNIRLPEGVQIVLLPNQTLTYVVTPGVNLTPEEYALLPQFLVAIQQQIASATGITLPPQENSDEIIDLDKDDTPPPEISVATTVENTACIENSVTHVAKTDNDPDSTEPNIDNISYKSRDEDFETKKDAIVNEKRDNSGEDFQMKIDLEVENKNIQNTVSASVDENASAVSIVDKPENIVSEIVSETNVTKESVCGDSKNRSSTDQDTKSNETQSTNDNTNKKSLLSDLMEMSGIMEEDLAPPIVPVEAPQEPIILDTSNLVIQQQVPLTSLSEALNSPPKEFFNAKSKEGDVELMAVTSFAQLKYASDNQGLFFKLDLENGQLTSINVCIQKSISAFKSNSEIDLADDPDVSITGATGPKVPSYVIDRGIRKPNKPALLAQIQPQTRNPELMTTILEKKKKLMNNLSNNLKLANIQQSKMQVSSILKRNSSHLRPPPLSYYSKWKYKKKLQAKIDLVESDTPMEEVYLSSDSSDDEPLIYKAKRMRIGETEGTSGQVLGQDSKSLNVSEPQKQDISGSPDEAIEEIEMIDNEELTNEQQHSQEDLAQNEDEELNNAQAQGALDDGIDGALTENEEDYIEEHLEEITEDEESQSSVTSSVPVPTNLLLSGGALNAHSIPLNYSPKASQNDDDDDDDNCILGV